MKLKKELIKREIAGDVVLVPVGKTVYEANGLFILNDVGAFLWDKLAEGNMTEEKLVDALLSEYDVAREVAEQDVARFVKTVRDEGMLDD